MENYLKITSLSSYNKSFEISNNIWNEVLKWDNFAKNTVGQQFVSSADSISANIAEGFGRYTKKDKIRFYRIAQGSLQETFDWLEKTSARKLIDTKTYDYLCTELNTLPKELNQLIKFTNEKLKF